MLEKAKEKKVLIYYSFENSKVDLEKYELQFFNTEPVFLALIYLFLPRREVLFEDSPFLMIHTL